MSINCCPKCGGTNGYEAVLTISYDMGGAWGKEWETTGSERTLYKSKTARCVDCRKRIPLLIACGDKEETRP